jgi:hypothetical protein
MVIALLLEQRQLLERIPVQVKTLSGPPTRSCGRCSTRLPVSAPPDDEPETEEERRAVHEAREELARGEGRRELGR